MRKNNIITIGETTYDIVFKNDKPVGAVVGGSVLNTSVSLGRLKLPVIFVSRVGNDKIGDLSVKFLNENGVNVSNITRFEGNSRLSLAFLDQNNEAHYNFYKAQKAPELHYPLAKTGDLVLFASTHAVRDEGRNALLLFLNHAHDLGLVTIYDPNIRNFPSAEMVEIRKKVEENIYLTRVLKGSVPDFQAIYDTADPDEIFERVNMCGVEALVITSGAEPVLLKTRSITKKYKIPLIETISTIGAGDNFTAGIIYGFRKHKIDAESIRILPEVVWDDVIGHAISFSSEVCMSSENYISLNFAQNLFP
jgi:fructokinase